MNNKWEKDWYYWVLSYMLVQTIQSDFDEGTEDLIKTVDKLLEFPIQPIKRAYIQAWFQSESQGVLNSPQQVIKQSSLNTSTNNTKQKINFKNPRRSKSTQKKLIAKDKTKIDKDKEKDKVFKQYLDHIIFNQKLNGMEVNPYGNTRFLKFVIGKGNNSLLSRVALKTRWWWSEVRRNGINFNFIWTQWKAAKVINHLPKKTDEGKELKCNDIKDDTTKNSDTDEITSLTQSTTETLATPSSDKLSRINSESNTQKIDTPEPQTASEKKSKTKPPIEPKKEPMDTENTIIWNHVEGHVHLSNKKALYYNMRNYYESIGENPFKYIPLTYHIQNNLEDKEYERFAEEFKR